MNFLRRIGYETVKAVTSKQNARLVSTAKNRKDGVNEEYVRIPREKKDDDILKDEILRASLNYVNTKGWTEDAIRAGAEDAYQAGELAEIFMEYDLVKYFLVAENQNLEDHLSTNSLNLEGALDYRLRRVIPYRPRYSEALAYATQPSNVSESMRLLLNLSDSIAHHSMKDTSTNIDWYTKRLGIASIYVSSELCLLQDNSENFMETFEFLKRRVKHLETLGAGDFLPFSIPLPFILSSGFSTAMNILGRNCPR